MEREEWVLVFSCDDRVGIVSEIAGALARHDGFILDSQQYADLETGKFFMRVLFAAGGSRFPGKRTDVEAIFAPLNILTDADWRLVRGRDRPGIVVAASRGSHCVNDLLHRWRTGGLPADIRAVASNHNTCRSLAEHAGVPFHFLPADDKPAQEAELSKLMDESGAEFLILARYMQILSPAFVDRYPGRIVNIHHSFLPGFKGAEAYRRAHERGVKLIGATAHFVTVDLDEGPIIEQDVERVDHRADAATLASIGRDIETRVLARAVGWVASRRVLINGTRTVVFR